MRKTLQSIRFLFTAPFILLLVWVVHEMTSPVEPWFHWAALGIGIAWVMALFRVLTAAVAIGGLAALYAFWRKRSQ